MQRLGAAIRERRNELGLTQEELAERLAELGDENIRQSDISRIEGGQVQLPRFDRLNYLSTALGISIGEMFINAGWISLEELETLLAAENRLQASAPELEEMEEEDDHVEVPDDDSGPIAVNSHEDYERFRRNRIEFERVRELYEEAKEGHHPRQENDSEETVL
ncbi:MAG: helix-turn-helix transcriptional regulator [Thermomicrobiales bacterium]